MEPFCAIDKNVNGISAVENSIALPQKIKLNFLKKLNIELPYYPAIPFLGIHPKELTTGTHPDICTRVHSSMTHNNQRWKQSKRPFDG